MEIKPTFWPTEIEANIFKLLMDIVETKSPSTILRVSGGLIRDRLLGIESSDIDIAVDDMTGEQFCELITEYLKDRSFDCNKFSVVKANPDQSKHLETAMMKLYGINIDFVNLRKESYTDSRIPVMEFGTPQEDAQRRDLTINAMFYNINSEEIEDFVGGILDLELKIARTPIDPIQTFIDDPLRILRVIRFAAKYDLSVGPELIYACHDERVRGALKTKVTPERKWKEIGGYSNEDGSWKCGFLATSKAHIALELLHKMNIADLIFGDNQINFYEAYYNLSQKFHQIKDYKSKLILNLATIFNDPDCCMIDLEDVLLVNLKSPKDIFKRVKSISGEAICFINQFETIPLTVPSDYHLRLFLSAAKDDWHLALTLAEMNKIGNSKEFEIAKERIFQIVKDLVGWKVKSPISGKHLIEIGFPADKSITTALQELDIQLLHEPKMTMEEALKFCKQFMPIS
jgi:tRNA nucleotidyltransferase/poly(A) polymerase